MARRRKRSNRRKNPSGAQWAVLAVGGVAGLGLLGWGIYELTKKKATPGLGFGGSDPFAPSRVTP